MAELSETILPATDQERRLIQGIRQDILDQETPITPEDWERVEAMIHERIVNNLRYFREAQWDEEVPEEDEPPISPLSEVGLMMTARNRTSAAVFLAVEQGETPTPDDRFFEIRAEDHDD
jgi:hypothetical protein